jgi:hypothetical protein
MAPAAHGTPEACSILGRQIAGIGYGRHLAGLASPTDDQQVKAVMRGARRGFRLGPVWTAPVWPLETCPLDNV